MPIYHVAGCDVAITHPVELLAAYQVDDDDCQRFTAGDPQGAARHIIAALAGANRTITCQPHQYAYQITVDGVGQFSVRRDGRLISVDAVENSELIDETIVAPPLILALACQRVWMLHAGTVLLHDQAVAFIGDSGVGKSTLTAYLRQTWPRLTDDLLPVSLIDSLPVARPHFPQFKLTPIMQLTEPIPQQITLSSVFLLDSGSHHMKRLEAREAVTTLIRHTAGTAIFDQGLQSRHLATMIRVVEQVPVYQLVYPRTYEALPLVQAQLEAHQQTLHQEVVL